MYIIIIIIIIIIISYYKKPPRIFPTYLDAGGGDVSHVPLATVRARRHTHTHTHTHTHPNDIILFYIVYNAGARSRLRCVCVRRRHERCIIYCKKKKNYVREECEEPLHNIYNSNNIPVQGIYIYIYTNTTIIIIIIKYNKRFVKRSGGAFPRPATTIRRIINIMCACVCVCVCG